MSDSEDLISQIKNDLEKSGFGSEMKAIRTFLDCGWNCSGGPSYIDRDHNQSREFDVLGHYHLSHRLESGHNVRVLTDITAEVKKSDRPWVVFKHVPNSEDDLFHGWTEVPNHSESLPLERAEYTDVFDDWSLTNQLGWKGYAVHESFKSPDQPSRWYAAAVTACKAAEHQIDSQYGHPHEFDEISRNIQKDPPLLNLAQPLVILDGLLFVAEIGAGGELKIERAEMTSVDFHFSSPAYSSETYRIPIVRLGALPTYLNLVGQRTEAFLKAILTSAGISTEPPASPVESST